MFRRPWALLSALSLLQACTPTAEEPPTEPLEPAAAEQPQTVPGFAELHHHMFAEQAFSGGWFHGSHTGTQVNCDGGKPESNHARLRMDISHMLDVCPNSSALPLNSVPLLKELFRVGGAVASEAIGMIEGTDGDTGLHLGRKEVTTQWPRWDTIAHQQSWEGNLREAHLGGMSLVVVSLVSNGFLCQALPSQNLQRPCDEMADVEVQLQMAHDFDARTPWAEIALSPAHARQIIGAGKLAIVLSIEVSKLFGTKDWRSELNRFYAMGVRSLQPVHQLDNRFGGAALHNVVFQAAQYMENCHVDYDCDTTGAGFTLGFDVDASCRNTKGLTADGKALVQEMMAKGMLIDMAHMSERAVQDTFALAQANTYYPLYISHGHFREVMNPKLAAQEKTTPSWVVRYLRQTGGIFGLRTAHDETLTYTRTSIANNCHGSSRSFAQAHEYGRLGLKVPMAFGADLNGFIQQTRPRFGPYGACSAGFQAEADAQGKLQRDSGPARLGTDFDEYGLAHVGLLPELLKELKRLGANTTGLEGSAENFLRTWERGQATRTGMANAATDIDTSGMAPYVDKATREAQYPKLCGEAYATRARVVGQDCHYNVQCASNSCSENDCDFVGTCLCQTDAHCAPNQYCDWGLSFQCLKKKPAGASCWSGNECLSGWCGWNSTCS